MTIRPAGPPDCQLLASLHRQCFDQVWHADEFRALLEPPNAFALIANENENQNGFAVVRLAADEAEVLTIGVLPAARRQGVAKALMRAAAEVAGQGGATVLFLEASATNAAALALYQSLGLREVGRRRAYYRQPATASEDAIVFKADLPLAP